MYSQNLSYHEFLSLSELHGSSFFVLDPLKLRYNINHLRTSFLSCYHNVVIAYSYKTNYAPQVCRILHEEGAWAEVVSEMEYSAALRLGTPNHRIIYNGPCKSEWSFNQAALGGATINLDSERDLQLLVNLVNNISTDQHKIRVTFRTNFDIDSTISRFGFDVDSPDFVHALKVVRQLPCVQLVGLHCHFPNRDLDSFRRRVERLVLLCREIFPDEPPELLNIGGGFFSSLPYSLLKVIPTRPATFDDYGKVIGQFLTKEFPDPVSAPKLFIEPGTALVADVLTFYTQVVSIKKVRGRYFATTSGSIFDISPNAKTKSLPVTPILNPAIKRGDAHDFSIAGFTCIESDILSDSLNSPLEVGDALAYGNVGSYSIVMRPPFILPSNPILLPNHDSSRYSVIKRSQANSDVFDLFDYDHCGVNV